MSEYQLNINFNTNKDADNEQVSTEFCSKTPGKKLKTLSDKEKTLIIHGLLETTITIADESKYTQEIENIGSIFAHLLESLTPDDLSLRMSILAGLLTQACTEYDIPPKEFAEGLVQIGKVYQQEYNKQKGN